MCIWWFFENTSLFTGSSFCFAPRFQAFPRCRVERVRDGISQGQAGKAARFLRRAGRPSLVHCAPKQPCMCTSINNEETSFLLALDRYWKKSLTTIQKWTTTKKKWKLIHIICVYLSPHVKHCQRQCGITWGAINEPIRSSKAIAKCIIINFLDKNVVITCFHDRHAVFYFYRTWIRSLAMLFTHWPTHCR